MIQLLPRLLAVLVSVAAGTAQAVPVTQLASANVGYQLDDGSFHNVFSPNDNTTGATASNTIATPASTAGSVVSTASADLASAQLKAQTTVTATGQAGSMLFGNAFARMGDGFRSDGSGGGPFAWAPDSTAHFSFGVTGSVAGTPDFGGSFLSLFIFQAGTLNTVPSQSSGLIGGYAWTFGPQNQTLNGVTVMQDFASLPATGLTIDFAFAPGGDFDWLLVLGATGGLFGDNGAATLDADFSHTVTVGYSGPAGAVTRSVSGLFGAITDVPATVPEPGSLALAALALALAGVARRRGRA